jgi:hypothetical protein
MTHLQLDDLLRGARATNERCDITGMLLYAGASFVQTLEGPQDVVEDAFGRIAADPRHRDVFVALREDIEQRSFPDWSMGFREVSKDESQALPGFNDYLQAKGASREPGAGRAEAFHRAFRKFTP